MIKNNSDMKKLMMNNEKINVINDVLDYKI